MVVIRGGRPFYGVAVGILLLDTRFPRPPGDVGNAETFDFPVLYRVVERATPTRVVHGQATGLVEAFCAAARELEAAGVGAIATSCGFLALHQAALASAVRVPVFSSSLLQLPTLLATLPPERVVGVLTMDADALTPAHFAAVGVPALDRIVVAGLADATAFSRPLLENRDAMDVARAEAAVVARAERLARDHPEIGALLLECTNLPPYAAAIQGATGLPVWDAIGLVRWAYAAVRQRAYRSPPASST